ncbi:hypothetical protein AMQ84_20875, partial [Paenibacillus riograndensis]
MTSKEEKAQRVNKILKVTILTSQLVSLNQPLYANALSAPKAEVGLENLNSALSLTGDTYYPKSDYTIPATMSTYAYPQMFNMATDALTLIDKSPNSSGTSLSPVLRLLFDKVAVLGFGELSIYRQSDDSLVQRILSSGGSVFISGALAYVSLPEPLADDTDYYVKVSSGMFVNFSGQSFGGIQTPELWNFRTVDESAPVVMSKTPEGSGASLYPELHLQFNEAVRLGIGGVIIHETKDGSIAEQLWISGGTVFPQSGYASVSGSHVRLAAPDPLASGTSYYVEITSGLITDLAGNPYMGMTKPGEWTFRTANSEIVDYTAPVVMSKTPEGSGASLYPELHLQFNE